MAQPSVIVFSSSNVDDVPMLSDNNTFTGTNTFSGSVVVNGALSGTSIKDEDDMASDSTTAVPTQQSTKAYVDNKTTFTSLSVTSNLDADADELGFFGATKVTKTAVADPTAFGNADGEIGDLTISDPPTQGEVQALRDKCEELADDCRGLQTKVTALIDALQALGLV